MSIPRPIMQALVELRRALTHQGMVPPEAMDFPVDMYNKVLNGMADSYGMSRSNFDQQIAHGGNPRICGIMIRRRK